ncbi:GroEL-like equatorial domain [Phytophthora cactorum]|nr:GroEL-like equatorial domain [Phytophthora cactorum]
MEQLDRNEVKQRLIGVCKELVALVTQLRPLGRAQLLQANAQCPDALTATSVAERYLPTSRLQLALDWSLQYLEDLRCPVRVAVNWSSATSISAVIRGIISSKSSTGLDEGTTESVVIPLIIKAFVSVFGYVVEHPSETVPVQLLFAPGLESIAKSEVWKQTVLLDLPWPSRGRRQGAKQSLLSPPICNARVALFNITIEPLTEFEEEDANSGTSVNHTGSLGGFRLKALRQFGDRLERLGTSAVLSQKIIPKYLQTYLAAKGIFTLDRLSATYIRGVQMLSGATILSDWRIDGSIVSSSLGFLSLITTQILGSKQFIRLHRESPAVQNSHEVTTIAIAAPDRFAYAELSQIHLAALLRDRARQLRTPAPVSDGTVSRSAQVDKKSERTLRQLSQTVTIFADRLEDIAGQLCGSHASSTDRAAVIEQLRDANNESLLAPTALPGRNGLSTQNEYELFGWDPRKRSTMQVLSYAIESDDEKIIADAHILDILQSKKDALVLAIESVSSLARIASVVRVP